MSSRYTLGKTSDVAAKRFKADVTDSYEQRYNIAPTQLAPVMTSDSPKGFSFFYWGLITKWANNKSLSERLYITRAEQIPEKASARTALMERRCLIPADGFYEWKKVSKKGLIPYYFFEKQHEPFSMAGLWEEFEDEDGEQMHSFMLITCAANQLVAEASDRMPAMLDRSMESAWLDKSTPYEELLKMLKPFPALQMQRHPVSPKVNNIKIDGPELILPAPPSDQFGNYTLFD
jgi:putative SOS response-associated peptidase YedK